MSELTLHLPRELSEKLVRAANNEAKEPEVFALTVLELYFGQPSLEFIGAWADSDVGPEDVLAARTEGRAIDFES